MSKAATVALHGNAYEVDPALVGVSVELVFDPFDLFQLEVRHHGRPMGLAVPQVLMRRVHPAAVAGEVAGEPIRSGIDYLALVDAAHDEATRRRISYADLSGPAAGLRPALDDDGPGAPAVTR